MAKRPQTALVLTWAELQASKFSQNDSQIISKLLAKNNAYFNHIMDKCLCGQCKCGGCKCGATTLKEQEGMPLKSIYQQDFIEKHAQSEKTIAQLPTYKDNYTMKLESTYRNDFLAKKARPQTSCKQVSPMFLTPFHAGSTYKLTHTQMPDVEKVNIIPQNFTTVMKDLEFNGLSEYKRKFSGTQIERDRPVIFGAHSSFGNPINPNLPFFGTTTSQRAFRPFKGRKLQKDSANPNSTSVPSFFGQFTTTTKQDYPEKSLMLCPSKKILNERKKGGGEENISRVN